MEDSRTQISSRLSRVRIMTLAFNIKYYGKFGEIVWDC